MKTKARNGVIAASLASVALCSALCATGGGHAVLAEKAVAEVNERTVACEQVLAYVRNNLESIISRYNSAYNSNWAASDIEYTSPIFLLDDNVDGIYVDLDGNNGYFVMSTDHLVYDLETHGDLDYLRGIDKLYYHSMDGFLYADDNGRYQQFQQALQQEYLQAESLYNATLPNNAAATNSDSTLYPGQLEAGDDGKIDPNAIYNYVNARYPGFVLETMNDYLCDDFDCITQKKLSYYVKCYNGPKIELPENNYHLTAMYSLISDWGKRGHIDVPYWTTCDMSVAIKNDSFYSDYGIGTKKGNDQYGSYTWIKNESILSNVPELYIDIRGYALNKGYHVETGYETKKVPATMEYVMKTLYKNKVGIKQTTTVADVMSNINNKKACFISIKNSSTYQDHGAAVIGYYKYRKETYQGNFNGQIEFRYFYLLADGECSVPKIFDPHTSANPTVNFYYLSRC